MELRERFHGRGICKIRKIRGGRSPFHEFYELNELYENDSFRTHEPI